VRRREAPPHTIWVLCPNKNGDSYTLVLVIKISFLKACLRQAFKKLILVIPAPKALESPKSVSS
jgi:hypothetical protein